MSEIYFKIPINFCLVAALTLITPAGNFINNFFNTYLNSGSHGHIAANTPPSACNLHDATFSQCASSMVISVDPGYSNYAWSTGSTGNSITVTTSGTYWWETVNYAANAVVNGDFENSTDRYTGITSGYVKNTNNLQTEGQYAVLRSPKTEHPNFSAINDHTLNNGNGHMMVVNGASVPNVTVWSQSITVQANSTYVFSIWGTAVFPDNPGTLNFSINGQLLGNIQLTSTPGDWKNFVVRWDSNSSTTATIGIVNQNTAATGNDFALDDIVFAPVCRKNITVNLYPNPAKPVISN